MTFSTRNNPRLAQSGVALTSLGAVGGARGVSAGGLRVLIEFITQYSGKAVKEIERDMASLERSQRASETASRARAQRIQRVEQSLQQIQIVKRKLTAAQRKEVETINALENSRSRADKALAATRRTALVTELKGLKGTAALRTSEIQSLFRTTELEKRRTHLRKLDEQAQQRQNQRAQQALALEHEQAKIAAGRATLGAKLGGLAIGALGGIVGGAVLGVGFQLAEQAIEKLGDKLQDLIDPARHAREEIKGLAEEINKIADSQKISQLDAAKQFLNSVGIDPNTQKGADLARLLQELTVQQQINDVLTTYLELRSVEQHQKTLFSETQKRLTEDLINQAKAQGTYSRELINTGASYPFVNTQVREYINGVDVLAVVQDEMNRLLDEFSDKGLRAAAVATAMANSAAAAAAQLSVAAEQIANALQAAGNLQLGPIDSQLENLGDGTSARTKALEKKIAGASGGGGGANNSAQLRDIAEQRQILLLRQKLRLMGTAINLEKYSGKFLLEAINAKIAALQKEGQEQARLNQLLDLQYRMSQTLKRNEGESIQDFLDRRAQTNRDLLAEQDDLRRQQQISQLEELRDRVQTEVDLAELAERKKAALRKTGTGDYLSNLQKQLAASKAADAKALAAKRKALEKERDAIEEKVKEAIRLTSAQTLNETALAIKGSNSLQKLNELGGRLAGYQRAKATIQALVQGFGLPASIAAPLLAKINSLMAAYGDQYDRVARNQLVKPGTAPIAFAEGGVFAVKNSQAIFGQNVKTGEQGTEIGVILSNRVTQALRDNQGIQGQIGPFIIQQSDDPFRDRSRFGRLVRESVEAALG